MNYRDKLHFVNVTGILRETTATAWQLTLDILDVALESRDWNFTNNN